MFKKNILRLFYASFAIYFSFFYSGSVSALDPETTQRIKQGIGYYDPACDPTATNTESASNKEIKSVYMRGDSITVGAIDTGIEKDFKKDGISATVTGSGGGTVARAGGSQYSSSGDQLSGLDAIQKDKNKVSSADAVVVAYGTNNFPSEMSSEISQMVKKIKSINKEAQIFWVNTDTNSSIGQTLNGQHAYTSDASKEKNEIIEKQSQKLDFSVIDITSKKIPLQSDNIHPMPPDGYKKWNSEVVGSVKSGPTNSSQKDLGTTTGVPCCPNGGSSSEGLTGSNNEEKVWNYFKSKGLEDHLVAGIMGNISQESGFDPTIVQGGSHSKDPSSITAGWGLIQWTPGNKIIGIAKQAKINGPIYELETQLDIVWWHATNIAPPGGTNILPEFKKASNPKDAATAWEDLMEAAGDPQMEDRWAAADAAMDKYGGSGPSSSGKGVSSVGGNCECNGESSDSGTLSKALEELADKNGGKTQISVSSVNGDTTADSGGEVQMPTRSSYKIYTAYATLRAIEAGKITWSSRTSWGQSVQSTMEAMIVRSDNDAAEALRLNRNIGSPKEVTKMLQDEVGLSNKTVMGSGNANSPSGSNSQSTANDFTKFLRLLEKHRLPKVKQDSDYSKLIGFMKRATTDGGSARDGIVAGVGKGAEVADKPGWASGSVDPASNDVGIVYLKGNPYVISILTDKPNQWGGVANIAEQVHSLMSGSQGSNCAESSGDLSSIITSYAWPEYSSSRSDPKPEYKTAYDKAVSKGQYGGGGYTDCGAFVSRVMIDSGYEPKYNSSGKGGNTISQMDWLSKNWQKINVSTTKDLELGDVAINSTHTYLYVGKLPDFDGDSASASLHSRVPMASSYYSGFEWYRKK